MIFSIKEKSKYDGFGILGTHPVFRKKRTLYQFDQGWISIELQDHTFLNYDLTKLQDFSQVPSILRERKTNTVFIVQSHNEENQRQEVEKVLVYFETAVPEEEPMAVFFSFDKKCSKQQMGIFQELVWGKSVGEMRIVAAHFFRLMLEVQKRKVLVESDWPDRGTSDQMYLDQSLACIPDDFYMGELPNEYI